MWNFLNKKTNCGHFGFSKTLGSSKSPAIVLYNIEIHVAFLFGCTWKLEYISTPL